VVTLAAIACGAYLLHGWLNALMNFVLIETGLRGLARVRKAVFDWLLALPFKRLHGSQAGDLIYRATWDTYSFQTLFQHGVFTFLNATAAVVSMTVVMWRLNLSLTIVALATVPILLIVMKTFGRGMERRGTVAQSAESTVASGVQQAVSNLALIQGYAQEPREAKSFAEWVQTALIARRKQHGHEIVFLTAVTTIFALGTGAILWSGARQVQGTHLSVGQLLVFLAYLAQFYEPLNQLSHVGATVANARAGTQRILEWVEGPDRVAEIAQTAASRRPAPTTVKESRIEFDHVSFGYDPAHPVLKSLSLDVKPGEAIALIGPSGSGKSTLMNLVMRFYAPDQGSIRIGGHLIEEFAPRDLRSRISLVLQEPILLPATIAENIAYGRPDATPEEIEAAARQATAHEFICRLPKGYQSRVGDGAVRLSVGEKQRINLARAFLKDAPILLLDEPTSALDAESEKAVIEAVVRLMKNRTTLMVAHRLATVSQVDRIAVLREGTIVEVGTAKELLAQGGYFARISA
jgi:ATP-binding cassette subfamily B protein/subfamily B ATP-binding cassette protein MsbA